MLHIAQQSRAQKPSANKTAFAIMDVESNLNDEQGISIVYMGTNKQSNAFYIQIFNALQKQQIAKDPQMASTIDTVNKG